MRPETEVGRSLRLITPEPATSSDLSLGPYIDTIHLLTVVYTIHNIVHYESLNRLDRVVVKEP